jgi:hypothetical protein
MCVKEAEKARLEFLVTKNQLDFVNAKATETERVAASLVARHTPRAISIQDATAIKSALDRFRGQVFSIVYVEGDQEAKALAQDILYQLIGSTLS